MSTLTGHEELGPLIAEKTSAPDKKIPLKFSVYSPSDLLLEITLVIRPDTPQPFRLDARLCCDFRWVLTFPDFPSCKFGLEELLRDAINKKPGAVHLPSPDDPIDEVMMYGEFDGGAVVACWSPEDYLRESSKPTEAMVRPYSVVDGKLCWLAELDQDAAVELVANFLRVEESWRNEHTEPDPSGD